MSEQKPEPLSAEEIAHLDAWLARPATIGASEIDGTVATLQRLRATIDAKDAEIAELRGPCTCGSGGHPRYCGKHKGAVELHVARMNYDNTRAELTVAEDALVDAKVIIATMHRTADEMQAGLDLVCFHLQQYKAERDSLAKQLKAKEAELAGADADAVLAPAEPEE